MSDFEIFGDVDDSGGVDDASFEKFKERVKAAQAQIKALQKGEQKVRKKEEKLVKILLRFVKNHQKKDIMLLIARLLEQNVPAIFILSIVLLGNEDVLSDEEQTLLKAPEQTLETEEMSLAKMDKDELLPVKLKVRIDDWLKNIMSAALENPHKLLQTGIDSEKRIILPLVQLCAFILRDFLTQNSEESNYDDLKNFSQFFLSGMMQKVANNVAKQKKLKEEEESVS